MSAEDETKTTTAPAPSVEEQAEETPAPVAEEKVEKTPAPVAEEKVEETPAPAPAPTQEDEEHDRIVNELVEASTALIDKWSIEEAGSFNSWLGLMRNVMETLETYKNKTGLEKASLAIDSVQKLAVYYYEKHKEEINAHQFVKDMLETIMSPNGAYLLNGGTTFIKNWLKEIDLNGDGEISKAECDVYLAKACACCPCIPKKI